MKWYKHDPDAFNAGTAGLTLEEVGGYILLINLLYARDGDVPNDDRLLAGVCRCRPQVWRRVRDRLVAKGKVRITPDGKLTANRVQTELLSALNRSETMAHLGRLSAENRRRIKAGLPTVRSNAALVTTTTRSTSSFSSEEAPAREAPAEPPEAVVRRSELEPSAALQEIIQRKLRG